MSASCRQRWRLVVVSVSSTAAAVSLLVFDSVRFGASSLLLVMYCSLRRLRLFSWLFFRLRCLVVFVIVGVELSLFASLYNWRRLFLSLPSSRCRRWHLVVVAMYLLLEMASLLVATSIGFCALLSLSLFAPSCCRWRLISFDGFLFFRCCRLLVIVVGVSSSLMASH